VSFVLTTSRIVVCTGGVASGFSVLVMPPRGSFLVLTSLSLTRLIAGFLLVTGSPCRNGDESG
jgi:hypothetical protein